MASNEGRLKGAARVEGLAGGAILCALLTGCVSIGLIVWGLLFNPLLAGLALIASAISFTGIANAILRR